ncbi:zinc finger protein 431-like [Mesocricetus auratus]|uniref:Zinc finger protein 431-like n=1 Tax=Mesocricetus auratus TaxID=10036 RepID=A0A1U7QKV6_MESAU|nr:zinc finger protein 431-like [Mesocricetus auratus]
MELSQEELENHRMYAVTYQDLHINFTQEEWALLDPSQKNLYKDVMLEAYMNLKAIGYKWEDDNIKEHHQHSQRHASVIWSLIWCREFWNPDPGAQKSGCSSARPGTCGLSFR